MARTTTKQAGAGTAEAPIRDRIRVTGVVQGVGFRPFVYVLAEELSLAGFVRNDANGVLIEVEGGAGSIEEFRRRLLAEAPPQARIEEVAAAEAAPTHETGFVILPSEVDTGGAALVSPDLRTCDDCIRELHDPADRRFHYPFVNCTNCGPRFTITLATPYDRPSTTMAPFVMCDRCRSEYDDPRDRRFHAQPNACADCGPGAWVENGRGQRLAADAVGETRRLIAAGHIVAIKGLGGFHLACDARSDATLRLLRQRKGRVDKPFAVMVADIATTQSIATVGVHEEELLASPKRPIVLLRKRPGSGVSALVAPGNNNLGVMLPYTPLHSLLVAPGEVWVMTSANRSQEPIVHDNGRARAHLADLADAFLMHDRDIHVPVDDSVVRVLEGRVLPVRRSRGYAPFPIELPFEVPPLLATGGELKATFCLAAHRHGFMSQHIGDMENLETLDAFAKAVAHMERLFRIEPEILVTDLHPRYLSARWAERVAAGRPVVRVQHHHAHIASVMAEHGVTEPVIGFSFDGTGYGTDGTVWGGEVLIADFAGFDRTMHLAPVPLAGGDAAIRHPYRMALAHLWAAGIEWSPDLPPVAACPPQELAVLRAQLERQLNTMPTTSMGRLFDAVSSLVGVAHDATYEGQAAIELEALSDAAGDDGYRFGIGADRIDPAPVLEAVVADVDRGVPVPTMAGRFHRGTAAMIADCAEAMRTRTGIGTVGLSGGVFQNAVLVAAATSRLQDRGFRVLTHRSVPPNDGGLALGQAVIAAERAR